MILWKLRSAVLYPLCLAVLALGCATASPARAANPIKVGFSIGLTGATSAIADVQLAGLQIWRAEVNAHGGLLGRPVKFVYYDDQSNPANVPNIYAKLIDIDHVNLLLGNGTYAAAAAMPVVMSHHMMLLAQSALAVNDQFHYSRYFQTMPFGPHSNRVMTRGFFAVASRLKPKPKTVALLAEDVLAGVNAIKGARENAKHYGFKIVYDEKFPPHTVDCTSIIKAVEAAKPDLVVVGSYPDGTSCIISAAAEMRLHAQMFGGALVGAQITAVKQHFGDKLNGVVNYEIWLPVSTMKFPGIVGYMRKYRAKAAQDPKLDPLGFYEGPLGFTTMQVLQQAVEATKTLNQGKLAAYMHRATFHTILGNFTFGPKGEWSKPQILTAQFQRVHGHGLEQFTRPRTEVILYPNRLRSGKLMHPYPLGH